MERLTESFGRLSTTAREWKPQQSSQQQQSVTSTSSNIPNPSSDWQEQTELNAATVKEFVPGLGWTAHPTNVGSSWGAGVAGKLHAVNADVGGMPLRFCFPV